MTSINNIEDLRKRKVLGVIAKDENFKQIVVGCALCDGEFLTLNSFEKHVSTCHDINFGRKPNDKPKIETIDDDIEHVATYVNIKVETIDLVSDGDDEEIKEPEANKKSQDAEKATSNNTKIPEKPIVQPQPSTSRNASDDSNVKCENSQQQGTLSLKCRFCSKAFLGLLTLNLHIHKCSKVSPNLKCNFCGKIYSSASSKRHHIHMAHKIEAPFACKSCSYRYSDLDELKHHIQHRHANGTIEKCSFCKKSFPSKFELNLHIRKMQNGGCTIKAKNEVGHTGRIAFECYICSAQKQTQFALIRHFKAYHP